MNVACPGCGTKYALLDEKIRGRRVRLTCKHCSSPIVVDGTTTSQPVTSTPANVASSVTAPANTPTNAAVSGSDVTKQSESTAPQHGMATAGNRKGREDPKRDPPTAAKSKLGFEPPTKLPTSVSVDHAADKPRAPDFGDAAEEPTTASFSLGAEEPATISLDRTSEKPATVRLGRAPKGVAVGPGGTPSEIRDDGGATLRGVKVPTIRSAQPEAAAAAVAPSPHANAASTSARPAIRAAAPRGFRGTIIGVAEPANAAAQGSPAVPLGSRSYSPAPRRNASPTPAPLIATAGTQSHPPLQKKDAAGASASVPARRTQPAPPPGSRAPVPRLVPPPSPSRPIVAAAPVGHSVNLSVGAASAALSHTQSSHNPSAAGVAVGSAAVAASAKSLETPHPGTAASLLHKPARGMHRTIIGVAAPANAAGSDPGASQRTSVRLPSLQVVTPASGAAAHTALDPGQQKRALAANLDLKRTIIGGLEAPSPLAAQSGPAAQLVPTLTKWLVLFPKQGTAEMSEVELVRAFSAGEITRDASVWREGMREWQPLGTVPSLLALIQRARTSAAPPAAQSSPSDSEKLVIARGELAPTRTEDQAPAPTESQAPAARENQLPSRSTFDQEQPTLRHSTTLRPTRPSAEPGPVGASESCPPTQGARHERFDTSDGDEITRISTSPWDVPDVGAKATARLAESAGLPPRQMSIPPAMRGRFDDLPLDRPSRRPDIGPRATVRGQLAALASSVPPARVEHRSERSSESAARVPRDTRMGPFSPASSETPAIGSARSPALSQPSYAEGHDAPIGANAALGLRTKTRRLHRRWWFWVLLVAGLFAIVGSSYRTKQPRALYQYMHARGWDVPIDRTVQRVKPRLGHAAHQYIVRPYRAVAEKFRRTPKP